MAMANKSDVVRDVAEVLGVSQAAVKAVADALFDEIGRRAARGDTVRMTGFGSFRVRARPPRTARNPRTGEEVAVGETRRLTFRAARSQ